MAINGSGSKVKVVLDFIHDTAHLALTELESKIALAVAAGV